MASCREGGGTLGKVVEYFVLGREARQKIQHHDSKMAIHPTPRRTIRSSHKRFRVCGILLLHMKKSQKNFYPYTDDKMREDASSQTENTSHGITAGYIAFTGYIAFKGKQKEHFA